MRKEIVAALLVLAALSCVSLAREHKNHQHTLDARDSSFKESVVPRAKAETQNREWDTDGDDEENGGGSTIILSNRNQIETIPINGLPSNTRSSPASSESAPETSSSSPEAAGTTTESSPAAPASPANEGGMPTPINSGANEFDAGAPGGTSPVMELNSGAASASASSNPPAAAMSQMPAAQPETAEGAPSAAELQRRKCPDPSLHNEHYSFESVKLSKNYLQAQSSGNVRVDAVQNDAQASSATFLLVSGLASSEFVSFQSYQNPQQYLRFSQGKILLETRDPAATNVAAFNADATFKVQKGLAACEHKAVSFEVLSAPKQFVMVDAQGEVVARPVTADSSEAAAASFLHTKPLAKMYLSVPKFTPAKNTKLLDGSKFPQAKEYAYMFWIFPSAKVDSWANIFHKGSENNKRNPAVFFYPGSTKLHVRSGTVNGWNDGADPNVDLAFQKWSHVVITHAVDGEFKVYINGEKTADTKLSSGPVSYPEDPLYGSDQWHPEAKCTVADLRIYSRVPTIDEIAEAAKQAPAE